jgi:glycosyltransferase involved in cell wall biosynthesis
VRIGFDAKRLFNNFTGLGNYSRFVVNALSDYYPDNDYELYSPKVRNHPEVDSILKKKSVRVHPPSSLTSSFRMGSFWRSYRLGKVAAQDAVQIFHGLSNELPITKPPQLKTVLTVHDVIFKRFPEFYKPIDIALYSWKLANACRSADKIIAVSKQTADDLIEFFQVNTAKVNEVRKRYKLPQEYILNVGTIESRKNVLVLLQSLKYVKHDIPVVIVGKATSYLRQLTSYIASNGLEKRVIFIHHAVFEDLPSIYKLANVFVYPSLFEGFGIPIVEAISCEVPVITSKGSCFAEAGGPDCLYVDTKSPEQLADAIQAVLSDQARSNHMIEKSMGYIARFEPKTIASELMKVYTDLIQ